MPRHDVQAPPGKTVAADWRPGRKERRFFWGKPKVCKPAPGFQTAPLCAGALLAVYLFLPPPGHKPASHINTAAPTATLLPDRA